MGSDSKNGVRHQRALSPRLSMMMMFQRGSTVYHASVILNKHNQANIEQSWSKHPANAFKIHVHDVCSNCSVFARRLLENALQGVKLGKIGKMVIIFLSQTNSPYFSGLELLCKISSKLNQNCGRSSVYRQTYRMTDRCK